MRAALLLLTVTLAATQAPRTEEPRVRLLVPAYFYPAGEGLKDWERLFTGSAQVPIVAIVNPASGPGKDADANYVKLLQRAKEHKNLTPIGYVSTAYGKRKVDDVKADVDRWLKLYPSIQGIFFDEQASGADHLDYYAALYAHVRTEKKLSLVLTNPGTVCAEGYLSRPVTDSAVLFEGPKPFDPGTLPDWVGKYPPTRVGALSYKVGTAKAMQECIQATAKKVGWYYVTDGEGANPWGKLPSYWEEEIATVRKVSGRP
jgi:hypothetical protein